MKDIEDDNDDLINGGSVPTKGERQKAYRQSMIDKGLKAKQLWVPLRDVAKLEAYALQLRNKFLEENAEVEDLI